MESNVSKKMIQNGKGTQSDESVNNEILGHSGLFRHICEDLEETGESSANISLR